MVSENIITLKEILNIHKEFLPDWEIFCRDIERISFEKYINKFLDIETKKNFVEELNNCNCCYRHQLKKPSKYEKWVELPFSKNDNKCCSCPCRHFSRFICRTYKQ